jgi:hypothetical protein
MTRVYICFAPRDESFVSLLKRLLSFHQFATYSNGSGKLPETIGDTWVDPAILQAEVCLMVLSKNMIAYDWALQELDTFLGSGPGKVIWLALDDIDPSQFDPSKFSQSLKPQTVVNFHSNLEKGFEMLFAELGAVFLEVGREGAVTDRRKTWDRRRSSTAVRLREGFLKAYKQGQPYEVEYLRIPRSVENRRLLYDILLEEARRYSYCDRVSELPNGPEEVLDQALGLVWAGGMSGEDIAVNLIEDVASAMEQNNRVEALQRRSA